MRSVLVRGLTSRVRCIGLAALLFGVLTPATAWGQEGRQLPVRPGAVAPDPADFDLRAASAFDLFGDADLAVTGTRGRGTMTHNFPNDGGLLDYYWVLGDGNVWQSNVPDGTMQAFFMGSLWLGSPKSEWERARQAVPSLDNVTGGGWNNTFNVNAWFFRVPAKLTPKDGQLGLVHSGVSNTDDGACTDFTDDFVDVGAPLMASSDCPATWGTDQFAGAGRLIPITAWEDYFNAVGAANFNWDWWQVPPEYVSDELIGDWQSYGAIADWGSDNLSRYGAVMPGGTGTPEEWGWPMGITVYFDVYSFQNPAIANATYFRSVIVNESRELYGVPLDYDSLYFGVEKGELMNYQWTATYFRPELGGAFMVSSGIDATCNGARTPPGAPGCGNGGWNQGAVAVLVLNSPLGDLRNKHFSDPQSSFYAPTHPLAGDTITFNQGRKGGWGAQYQPTTFRSARSGFGYHAGVIPDLLDGRSEADYDASAGWFTTFNNQDFPVLTAQFNKWAPGNWDWNHDGVQDTLTLVSCLGPNAEMTWFGNGGCADLWSDTLPGRLVNAAGNFGGHIGFGPFRLAADSSARFTFAVVTGENQGAIEANTRNVVATYMNAYLRPSAAPPPSIISVATTPGDRGRADGASVQLFWDDAPEEWTDPFLVFTASQLQGTQLLDDNPWLDDSLLTVSTNNVQYLQLYKSCDFGQTFTNDTNCLEDPAQDEFGNNVALGWQPYRIWEPDENGNFPNAFVDNATTPGKKYLYSLVTQSRGFTVNVLVRDANDSLVAETLELAPSLYTVLSTSTGDPSVTEVYVPASREAGGRAASVEFTLDSPINPTEYYPVEVLLTSDIDEDASYSVVFGDSVVVTNVHGDTTYATVDLYRTVVTSTDGGATLDTVAYESESYSTDLKGVQFAGGVATQLGDTTTTVYANELTLLALTATGEPLFTSSILDGANTTPGSFLGRTDFPRWLLNVDNEDAGDYLGRNWFQMVDDSLTELRSQNNNFQPTVTWNDDLSEPTGESYNTYWVEFADCEFGPGNSQDSECLFELNLRDPEQTNADFQASLEARAVGSVTSTSQEVADALGVSVDSLLAVNLPFEVMHEDPTRNVTVAMLASDKLEQIWLGRNVDRVQVDVPADQWVPGEPLYFLETVTQFERAEGSAGEYIVTSSGQPVVADTFVATFDPAVISCTTDPITCNPVAPGGRGADNVSHLAVTPGQMMRVRYLGSFTPQTSYAFDVTATVSGNNITEITQADLDSIYVVPNPYVVFSAYEQDNQQRRIMFTNLPPQGKIEIYTVSGQFVQRINYDQVDLEGNGDLFWNMRTRENTDLASGLYIFVVTGSYTDANNAEQTVQKLGKFVVIR